MYIRIPTEEDQTDGRNYATSWSICKKADKDLKDTSVIHSKKVPKDFFRSVRYWYIKDGMLRKNPHRNIF